MDRAEAPPARDVTALLLDWRAGDPAAFEKVFTRVYNDLRRRAEAHLRRERVDHTLSTTALVHEAYFKLVDLDRIVWQDRAHFLAMASRAMRQVLVSYARKHRAAKRGGDRRKVRLDDAPTLADTRSGRILALDLALEKLEVLDERKARVVEHRFFGGLTIEETAEALDIAPSTVKLDWKKARAWLRRELSA